MLRKVTKLHVYVQCFFQAWEDLPKFDTTTEYSYLWSIFSLSAKPEKQYTEAIQGQTFAINELDLWWHRTVHWLN